MTKQVVDPINLIWLASKAAAGTVNAAAKVNATGRSGGGGGKGAGGRGKYRGRREEEV